MSIKPGDKVPSVVLRRMQDGAVVEVKTDDLFGGRNVIVVGVFGAFTPPCSNHLPGYVSRAGALKAKGVDEIVFTAVNDAFVMHAWEEAHGAAGKVSVLADGSADFARALGLDFDASAKGFGTRSKRYRMQVIDGVVKSLDVEPVTGEVTISDAESCLAAIG
jgi:glutaredoxin/glutathione-dependent peroxiredoxin